MRHKLLPFYTKVKFGSPVVITFKIKPHLMKSRSKTTPISHLLVFKTFDDISNAMLNERIYVYDNILVPRTSLCREINISRLIIDFVVIHSLAGNVRLADTLRTLRKTEISNSKKGDIDVIIP